MVHVAEPWKPLTRLIMITIGKPACARSSIRSGLRSFMWQTCSDPYEQQEARNEANASYAVRPDLFLYRIICTQSEQVYDFLCNRSTPGILCNRRQNNDISTWL